MVDIKRIKQWIWYQQRIKYLKKELLYAQSILNYFESVRSYDLMRQKIGLNDLNMSKIPRANPKKEKAMFGTSTRVMETIVNVIPNEFEKLKRWRNINNISNKSITGKVIFS